MQYAHTFDQTRAATDEKMKSGKSSALWRTSSKAWKMRIVARSSCLSGLSVLEAKLRHHKFFDERGTHDRLAQSRPIHGEQCSLISSLALDVTHKKRCLRLARQSSHLSLFKRHPLAQPRNPFLTTYDGLAYSLVQNSRDTPLGEGSPKLCWARAAPDFKDPGKVLRSLKSAHNRYICYAQLRFL